MAHKQCGLWREKEKANPMPKACPKCNSKVSKIPNYADDEDEIDAECAEAWGIEWGTEHENWWCEPRFSYYEDHYECRRCGHYDAYGVRHYYNPSRNDYSCDRPLMPEAAKRAEIQHEIETARKAGQMGLPL